MTSPLKAMYVTSPFGVVRVGSGLPDSGGVLRHIGVDLRASIGTSVYSPTDGKVTLRDDEGLKLVEIKATDGKLHRFLHLSKNILSVGASVKAGQLIGYSGDTGGVAAHLHWDVRKPNTVWSASFANYYDPIKLISEEEEMLTKNQVRDLFVFLYGRGPSDTEYAKYIGKTTYEKLRANMLASAKFAGLLESASAGKLNAKNHLITPLKRVYVAPPTPSATVLGAGLYEFK